MPTNPDFYRTSIDDSSFIRGAARLLIANITIAFPTKITDIIDLTVYNVAAGWTDLGATKTGCQISVNNTEDTFDVDQILGDIDTRPTAWEYTIATALAEATPDKMQLAWEGQAVTTDASPPTGPEKVAFFGNPVAYTQRRLAVLYQRPSLKVRAYIFRKVVRMPQASTVTYAKTGEQQTIPVQFKALPDMSISDALQRVFVIRDQT